MQSEGGLKILLNPLCCEKHKEQTKQKQKEIMQGIWVGTKCQAQNG